MEAILKPVKQDKWYKEPWLLLVVGGPLTVVCASVFTGYVAFNGSDKVVAEDYYKQGLMINKDIQRDAKARAIQLAAELALDATQQKILVSVSAQASLPELIQLSIANAAADGNSVNEIVHRIPLHQVAPGKYEAETKLMSQISSSSVKLFHIKMETSDWRLTGDWYEPAQKTLKLNAEK